MQAKSLPTSSTTNSYPAYSVVTTATDRRDDNAMEKRRQWMRMMGMAESDIAVDSCDNLVADLDEEILSYNAAVRLQEMNKRWNR